MGHKGPFGWLWQMTRTLCRQQIFGFRGRKGLKFPKSMQALFLNFCYRSLPHIRIDFIEDYFGSTTFLTARPFAVLCRKLL
jgi:hypothetical protein